jgi:transcriptional regulator with XRE-family HTH domain
MMYSTSGSRIKKLRAEKNLSGTKVAEIIGISPQYYYELEKGTKRLNEELLNKLADFYNTSADYILCRTNTALSFKQENQDEYEIKKRDDIFKGLSEEDRKELERYAKYLKAKDKIDN